MWATAHHTRPNGRHTTSQRSMNERSMNERSTSVKVSTYYRREGPTARVLGSPIGDTQPSRAGTQAQAHRNTPHPPYYSYAVSLAVARI